MSISELAAEQLRADALQEVGAAEAVVEEGRKLIAEGELRVEAGEAAVAEARMQLRFAERFIANVRRLEAERAAAEAAPVAAVVAAPATAASAPVTNGWRSMVPVLDELMGDGEWHTIDELFAAMESRGYKWSRGSVMNRCAARANRGVYVRHVREDGKSAYRLAARSGDELPLGSANPEGGREPQPEDDPQLGAGSVKEAGSLAI